jgi:hypothetical protein
VLVASRRFDGSRSRNTKGSFADTLQCNNWRRAQSPHRMTHSLQVGNSHGKLNGFTALGKAIGTPYSTDKDCAYVTEHPVLKAHGAACGQKSASGTLGAHFVLSKRY